MSNTTVTVDELDASAFLSFARWAALSQPQKNSRVDHWMEHVINVDQLCRILVHMYGTSPDMTVVVNSCSRAQCDVTPFEGICQGWVDHLQDLWYGEGREHANTPELTERRLQLFELSRKPFDTLGQFNAWVALSGRDTGHPIITLGRRDNYRVVSWVS
jgi:hypothetical protein